MLDILFGIISKGTIFPSEYCFKHFYQLSAHNVPIGCLVRDPSTLHRVGHVLLQLKPLEFKRTRRLIIADDLFQLSNVPKWKTVNIVKKVAEKLSGCKSNVFLI